MKIQIPARDVSPAVIYGRPHVFWLESATKPVNTLVGGNSTFAGYDHRIQPRFTALKPDGSWAAPQPLTLLEAPGIVRQTLGDRFPIVIGAAGGRLAGAPGTGAKTINTPQLSKREGVPETHPEPREAYGLPGPVLPYMHPDVLVRSADLQDVQALAGDLLTDVDLFRR